jgi:hypothetical protein
MVTDGVVEKRRTKNLQSARRCGTALHGQVQECHVLHVRRLIDHVLLTVYSSLLIFMNQGGKHERLQLGPASGTVRQRVHRSMHTLPGSASVH